MNNGEIADRLCRCSYNLENAFHDPITEDERQDLKAINAAMCAISDKEKYRWHSLKENPDDLPKELQRCLTTDGEQYEVAWRNNNVWTNWRFIPIAWKIIEPYKEGDSDDN